VATPAPRWQYETWISATPESERLRLLRLHIAEVSLAIDADVAADGLSANHGNIVRYLEGLKKDEERIESRVSGSPTRR
jgi:hypothetical protein